MDPATENFKRIEPLSAELIEALKSYVPSCGLPLYLSADLRDSGYRIAAVDVNLFPGGFNHLSESSQILAAKRIREFFAARLLKAGPLKIAIYPESHTNNPGYLENLEGLITLLEKSSANVRLLWSGDPIPKAWTIKNRRGYPLKYEPFNDVIEWADALVLNHDLSGGLPEQLSDIKVPMFPHPNLGWYQRKKSEHFTIIDGLLKKLQGDFKTLDPWFYSVRTDIVENFNLDDDTSFEGLITQAENFTKEIRESYKDRGIEKEPSIFLKNDSGTYGMGVFSFSNIGELVEMRSQLKRKLRKGKGSAAIDQVILQEGLPTSFSNSSGLVGEPVIYVISGSPVGCFFRAHQKLGPGANTLNLNQPGSTYFPSDTAPFEWPRATIFNVAEYNKHPYGFLARLHAVAAALEECP